MAVSSPVAVGEYLNTVYRPDCDYVDGEIQERTVGEIEHSWVQQNIGGFFLFRSKQTGIFAMPELRFQLSPTRFRIPDLAIVRGKPLGRIQQEVPLGCVEILSSEDRISRVNQRIGEYQAFGVPVVWLVDPVESKVWIYRANGMQEATGETIALDGTDIEMPLNIIFNFNGE